MNLLEGMWGTYMTGITLEKGTTVYEYGQPMTALHLITSGKISASYSGGSYQLGKGDVVGICEICSEVHLMSYKVTEDATIITYPFSSMDVLNHLLEKHPDVSRLFILSACYQINTMLERCSTSEVNCVNFHQCLQDDYKKYILLCTRYRIPPRNLSNWNELTAYLGEEAPDLWLADYYLGFARIFSGDAYKSFVQSSSVSSGFLRKCSLDFRRAYVVLDEQHRYLQQITGYYFHSSGNDLFDFYTSLYYKLGASCADSDTLFADISRIITQFSPICDVDGSMLEQRLSTFRSFVARIQVPSTSSDEKADNSSIMAELTGSLNTILEFAGEDLELSASFRQNVHTYKLLSNRTSSDEEATRLRATLTSEFYSLYSVIFERALQAIAIPAPVRMFLYFGYADEELAGIDNAICLYNLLDTMTDHSSQGVYTFYDWLLAIFQGKKEPSRNEFDQDYNDYIHKQKLNGNITDADLKALENDNMAKVNYELRNMFPTVNKITYGRVSVFCPLFSSDNVLKSLKDSYVTVSTVAKAIEQVKRIDYTLFYREGFDMENINVLGKELIHQEYLPDVILMPNVGIRGIMWQEIEGKRRNSSGRMLFSIFHLDDIELTTIRLAGEFRWELCKRIQGSRWNDITDPSLTSEYFDYIQFYRKNHDLSSEAKEKVRSGLQRTKNSFKEMFVRDYIVWIMFEGNGSPRLNKVARRILFTYCPFPKDICEKMNQNPMYTDILSHHEIKTAQKLHHIDVLSKKIMNSGQPIPDTLEKERMFTEGTIHS